MRQLPFHIWKKNEISPLSYNISINSRCFKVLNPTYKTLKLLEDLGEHFYSFKYGKVIGTRALKAEETKWPLANSFTCNMESNNTTCHTAIKRFKHVKFLEQCLTYNLLINISSSHRLLTSCVNLGRWLLHLIFLTNKIKDASTYLIICL